MNLDSNALPAIINIDTDTQEVEATPNFDYSQVDGTTGLFLRQKELEIKNIIESSVTKIGEILYKAQQKLASHDRNKGIFEEWYTYLGFKKVTVYNYINRYNYVVQNLNNNKAKLIEDLPLSLSYEISKPNAPLELVEKVFDGDITTHRDYKLLQKELEKKNKQVSEKDKLLAEKDEQLQSKQTIISGYMGRKPAVEVVEKVVTIEDPTTMEALKQKANQVLELNKKVLELTRQLEQLKDLEAKQEDIFAMHKKIEDAKIKHGNLLKEFHDMGKVNEYLNKAKKVITNDLMIIPLLSYSGTPAETDKQEVIKIIQVVNNWIFAMKEKFQIN